MSNIDQSLDDIIKSNKAGARGAGKRRRGGGGGAGGSRASGPIRNAPNRLGPRTTPSSIGKRSRRSAPEGAGVGAGAGAWQHDMFEDGFVGGGARTKPVGIETGTKLFISNLDHGVSTDDIKELFSEQGDLKRCAVHFDRSGRSKCTADVVFARKYDALKAMKHYNNVQLDGKPMKIECLGTNIATAFAASVNAVSNTNGGGGGGGGLRTPGRGRIGKRIRRKPAIAGGTKGSQLGGAAGGKGKGGGKPVVKSAQELDADLENYHAEAMQT